MRVKEPDTPVLFMDGVHPSFNSRPSYGWIPKGGRAEVPANTGRERVNLKVLNNRYYPTFRQFREELLMFFDRLPEEFADNLRSLLTLKFHLVSGSERRLQAVV